MAKSSFVYVTYIRTTPEKLWRALTEPEFTRKYWGGTYQISDWKKGSSWKLMIPDGRIGDQGEVLEIEPYKKLVVTWRNEFMPDLKAEGPTRCIYELEQQGSTVKLTLTHESEVPNSRMIAAVASGWPELLSALKSLLETGQALEGAEKWPEGI